MNKKLLLLDMKMSWYPAGELQFIVFRKKGHQLKYVSKKITHTLGTLYAITPGVLNRLATLTSQKPSLNYYGVEKIYPDHANSLREAGLAPPIFQTMGYLWRK